MQQNKKIKIQNYFSFVLSFIFCLLSSVFCIVTAQTTTSSPYSRYGIGDIQGSGLIQNMSMGGISQGINNPYNINISNPASYSSLQLTTFETAIHSNFSTLSTTTLANTVNSSSFGYLALAFPVSKKCGASLGLLPFSRVGYKISDEETRNDIGKIKYLYEGTGGINQFYAGASYKIYKNLSLGMNASYLFGLINKTRTVEIPDTSNIFFTSIKNNTTVSDFYFNYGLQYTDSLKKDWVATVGITGALSSKIKINNDTLTNRYLYTSTGSVAVLDTIQYNVDNDKTKGYFTLPAYFGIGVAFKKNTKWLIGIDYTIQNWSNYKMIEQNDGLVNSWKIATGVQYVPKADAMKGYFKLVQYRMGLYYSNTNLQINGNRLNDYGFSLGLGLPVRRALSTIHLAVIVGQRGTTANGLLQEQYTRFSVGFTLNDKWFLKRKYD